MEATIKYSLLELTQEILASMDSDEVNSISDTTEALQVAHIVRQAYFDIVEDVKMPSHFTPFELNPSLDPDKPVLMSIPSDINKAEWIQYNIQSISETTPNFTKMTYLPREEFLARTKGFNLDEVYVDSFEFPAVNTSSITFLYRNDVPPQYYTSLDNNYVVFDSYDSEVDSTLQKSKTLCYGRKNIPFVLIDGTIPDLDDSLFPRLLNDAKELAFAELKSVTHAIASRNSKRSRSRSFNDKFRAPKTSDFEQLANFGRK